MCCCCALVQELREVEIRGASYGKHIHLQIDFLQSFESFDLIFKAETEKKKMKNMTPPLPQFMEE